MAVSAPESPTRRRAAELDAAELCRLCELLERYRTCVARAAAGESLEVSEYALVERLLEQLWLPPSCWPRDVAAWREFAALRERMSDPVDWELAGPRQAARRHRLAELELLHPHVLCGLHVAAVFRWKSGARLGRGN